MIGAFAPFTGEAAVIPVTAGKSVYTMSMLEKNALNEYAAPSSPVIVRYGVLFCAFTQAAICPTNVAPPA